MKVSYTVYITKTKALVSCAADIFFVYTKRRFFNDAACIVVYPSMLEYDTCPRSGRGRSSSLSRQADCYNASSAANARKDLK